MSVIGTYARINEADLESLRADPEWIDTIYNGKVPGAEIIDVDKACDGIVWLLSRMPSPVAATSGAGFTLSRNLAPLLSGAGGRKERSMEAPYGAASCLEPAQVRELASWFSGIDISQLRSAYDPKAMAKSQVYPQIWVSEGAAAFEDYLLPRFTELRMFISTAAGAGQCVLVFFT